MKLKNPERFDIVTAEKVLEHVTDNPSQHNQTIPMAQDEICGSVGCIMGWALHFEGVNLDYRARSEWQVRLRQGDVLGLNHDEFSYIFTEGWEYSAISTLKDFIAQAKAAQPEPHHELSAADKAILDSVTTIKEGV